MGTRSTTKTYRDKKLVLALYKQYDGYTDSWGKELKDFIRSDNFVNGIPMTKKKVFNGIGDFALQLVMEFKEGAGGLYATTEEDTQEYNYEIHYEWNEDKPHTITITCEEEPKFKEVFVLDFQFRIIKLTRQKIESETRKENGNPRKMKNEEYSGIGRFSYNY